MSNFMEAPKTWFGMSFDHQTNVGLFHSFGIIQPGSW